MRKVSVELTSSNYFSGIGELLTNTSGEMPQTCARKVIIAYWCTTSTVLTWTGETPVCSKQTITIKKEPGTWNCINFYSKLAREKPVRLHTPNIGMYPYNLFPAVVFHIPLNIATVKIMIIRQQDLGFVKS